jgi:integrase
MGPSALQSFERHRQPPRWLTGGDLRRLLQAVPDQLFRLAFQLVLATGLRVSELTALRVDDFDPESQLLRVRHGKGGDGRMVLVPPTLRELFVERHPGRDPRPLLNATLNEALVRAQVAAGLTEHVTMHRLRHSFAIHSLRAGMDIVMLQELIGAHQQHDPLFGAQARWRWCIRIESPINSPQGLLKYLGAYVNRVAFSRQFPVITSIATSAR